MKPLRRVSILAAMLLGGGAALSLGCSDEGDPVAVTAQVVEKIADAVVLSSKSGKAPLSGLAPAPVASVAPVNTCANCGLAKAPTPTPISQSGNQIQSSFRTPTPNFFVPAPTPTPRPVATPFPVPTRSPSPTPLPSGYGQTNTHIGNTVPDEVLPKAPQPQE